jgi:hypothetical protein
MPRPIASLIALLSLPVLAVAAPAAADEPQPAFVAAPSFQPRTVVIPGDEPRGAFPGRPPEGAPRTFSGALSLGPGWLALRDKLGRDGQGAMALGGRIGVVLAPDWNMFLGFERNSTKRGDATFAQTAALWGVQRFLFGRLYVGGALGVAMIEESGVPDGLTDGPGYGFSAHVGVEALRTTHLALTAELGLTMVQYAREVWEMGGLRLGVVAF